MYALGSGEE